MKTELPTPSLIDGSTRYASPSAAPPVPATNSVTPRPSIASLEAHARQYDARIDARSDTFRAAVLLLAAIEYGLNVDALSRRTGYPRALVAKCARRLIDNGVWASGGLVTEWSPAEVASGAFRNDVAVAEGKLCRRVNANGEIEWAPPGFWNKSYEFIDAAAKSQLGTVYRDPTAVADATPRREDEDDDGGGDREAVAPPRSTTPVTQPPADIAPPAAPAPEPLIVPTPSAPGEPEPPRAVTPDAPPVRRPAPLAPVTPWPARPPSRPPAEIFPGTVWIG